MKKPTIVTSVIIGSTITLILLVLMLLIFGFHFTTEIPKGNELWGGYEADKEYVLESDVFLVPAGGGMAGKRLVLVPENNFSFKKTGGRKHDAPDSVTAYESDPEKSIIRDIGASTSKMDVRGIVRKGTRLRMIRLDHHKGWNLLYGSIEELTPWARILDGQFAGEEVDIDDVSDSYREEKREIFMHKPAADLIQPHAAAD